MEDVLRMGRLDIVNRNHNIVVEENGEFLMKNPRTKDSRKKEEVQ